VTRTVHKLVRGIRVVVVQVRIGPRGVVGIVVVVVVVVLGMNARHTIRRYRCTSRYNRPLAYLGIRNDGPQSHPNTSTVVVNRVANVHPPNRSFCSDTCRH